MTCAGCDSTSSTVLAGFRNDGKCPFCGLSLAAASEIEAIRKSWADRALRDRLEELIKAVEAAERRARIAEHRLAAVKTALESEPRHRW